MMTATESSPVAAPVRLSRLLRLAGPIVFAQIAFYGMQVTDTVIAGQLSSDVLAAVALGGTLNMIGFTFLLGIGLAVAPGVAQRFGAGVGAGGIGQFVSSSVALSVLLWGLWGASLWIWPGWVLEALDLEPPVRQAAIDYLRAISLGAPFLGLFFALRNSMEALGHSRPIMWLGLVAFVLNIPLDIALMRGFGPIPALGAAGCGLATALVHVALAAVMWWFFHGLAEFRPYRPQGRPALAGARELWGIGAPIGLALASEHAIFAAGGLLMTRFGTETLAASQIALNFTGIVFMVALGLGQATSVLVGQAAGAGSALGIRRAGQLGYLSTAVIAVLVTVLMLGFPDQIIAAYTSDAPVAAQAVIFIKIAAAFHFVDAMQALGAGALRGLKDTRYVMFATTLAYWGVGGALFIWLFQVQRAGPAAIWWIYCAALGVAALALGLRFYRQVRIVAPSLAS